MFVNEIINIILLGIVEGVTEFLPVSSTGHLILATKLLGYDAARWEVFNIVIQLGAILAIVVLYWRRLLAIATAVPSDPRARRFVLGILVAFLPAAIIGGLFSKLIKASLFNPWIVCATLVAGGLVLLVIDDTDLEVKKKDVYDFTLPMDLKIGIFQCLAMIPG
ncbi:undecaprenyl-diphosphatase, partial [Lactobacillus crispatus]